MSLIEWRRFLPTLGELGEKYGDSLYGRETAIARHNGYESSPVHHGFVDGQHVITTRTGKEGSHYKFGAPGEFGHEKDRTGMLNVQDFDELRPIVEAAYQSWVEQAQPQPKWNWQKVGEDWIGTSEGFPFPVELTMDLDGDWYAELVKEDCYETFMITFTALSREEATEFAELAAKQWHRNQKILETTP